ncbi:MAG: hypothetical protein ABFD96_17870 [Armatimonadia bacterium]
MKKKWQLAATIIGLLVIVVGMNTIADMQRQKAAKLAKEAEKARTQAEMAASEAHAKPEAGDKKSTESVFALPAASGPKTAPVKLEVFVNNSNTCHQVNVTEIGDLGKAYGNLLRMEWQSMIDPKVAKRSDMKQIGCDAGLLLNGKIEHKIDRLGGKHIVSFRGPVGDKYKIADLYAAINQELKAKGKPVPAAAKERAK